MCARRIDFLALGIITLLLVTGGTSTHVGLLGVKASSSEQGFAAASNGVPISRPFLIADQSVDARDPVVAYNSQQQEYLVVWWNDRPGCDDIAGQRVSRNGVPIGSVIWIANQCPDDRDTPDVAYNSQRNEYLIVWQQHDSSGIYSVLGQRITGFGQLQGSALDMSIGTSDIYSNQPSIAYDSTDDKYLMVFGGWNTLTGEIGLNGQAFNSDGSTWGPSIEITYRTSGYIDLSDLVYNPLRNEFLVVWDEGYTTTGYKVLGRRVKMTGSADVIGSAFTIFTHTVGYYYYYTRVTTLPISVDGQYLVVWRVCTTGFCDSVSTKGQLVSGIGNLEGGTINFPAPFNYVEMADIAACAYSNNYFMAWMQTSNAAGDADGGDIAARFVSVGGMIEPEFWLDGNTANHPAVACGANGDYLVAYEKTMTSTTDIMGRLVGNRLYLPLVRK